MADKTCQHVIEGSQVFGWKRCGKPARKQVKRVGNVCGVHANFWRDRGYEVSELEE